MKVPCCGGRKRNTATFFLFFWTWIQSWDELNERKSSRIHFLSDVFVAVAIVVIWAPSGSLPRAWSEISSPSLRNLIGQLSFLLVPNMVLAKMKIHEHRTKQTYESRTFQPLMSFWSQTLWVLAQFSTRCAFCFNTFSHLLYCVSCPCNSSFCFQFVRRIGSKALQCSVFQYLLGLLKSDEFSKSTVSIFKDEPGNVL